MVLERGSAGPSRVGKTKVGGIDLNKLRMRWVVNAVIALQEMRPPESTLPLQ